MRLHEFGIERPRLVLAGVFVLLAALAPGLLRLELRTDGRALLPSGSSESAVDRSIREEFGVGDELVVIIEPHGGDGVFGIDALQRLANLTRELRELPGLQRDSVRSLASEPGDEVFPGTLQFKRWLDPLPQTAQELARLRARIERVALYRGTLLSTDTPPTAAAIVAALEPGADRTHVCQAVQELLARHDNMLDRMYVVGAPVAESQLGLHLLEDLVRLVPLVFAVMALILYLNFRNVWAVILPLSGVGFALVSTLALMGWCGAPVYLTILVLPVILTSVGVADAVHILDRHVSELRSGVHASTKDALLATMGAMAGPILAAEVTTGLGFVSFAFSPMGPIRVFGVFTTVGVLLYVLWSLCVLPACLALLGARFSSAASSAQAPIPRDRLARWCRTWAQIAVRRRTIVLSACLLLVFVTVDGLRRVRVQDSWIDGFSRNSALRRDTERFDERFGGTHVLRIRVRGDVAAARGRARRADFEGDRLRLAGCPSATAAELRFHRLILRPSATGPGSDNRPIEFVVSDASFDGSVTSLALISQTFSTAASVAMLPAGVQEFDWELCADKRLLQPRVLEQLGAFESFLADEKELGVGAVLGPRAHLETLNTLLGGSAAMLAQRLSTPAAIDQTVALYRLGRGEAQLREIFNPRSDHALITVLVRHADSIAVGRLMHDIRDFERRELAPLGLRVEFGGDLALSQAMIDALVHTQVVSLASSVAGIFVILVLMTGSLVWGVCAGIPCAVAVLMNFAVLGWCGVPLGVATTMFAAMTLGVGVDYAIHITRAVATNARAGLELEAGILAALADVGPAVIVDALAVAAAFSVMMLSQVPPNAHLGALLALSIAVCLLATLFLLPALLRTAVHTYRRRERSAGSTHTQPRLR